MQTCLKLRFLGVRPLDSCGKQQQAGSSSILGLSLTSFPSINLLKPHPPTSITMGTQSSRSVEFSVPLLLQALDDVSLISAPQADRPSDWGNVEGSVAVHGNQALIRGAMLMQDYGVEPDIRSGTMCQEFLSLGTMLGLAGYVLLSLAYVYAYMLIVSLSLLVQCQEYSLRI